MGRRGQSLHDAAGGVCAGITRSTSGHGAALDVPGGPGLAWQHLHPQTLGEGSVPLLRMAELLKQAGLPPDGVLNVVNGDKGGGGRAADRPEGRCRVVVGSTPIAQYIYATASAHGKRVQALGGAKEPHGGHAGCQSGSGGFRPDGAAYGAAGERCMAISVARGGGTRPPMPWWRSLALVAALGRPRPRSESRERDGALISREHLAKVRGYVDRGWPRGRAAGGGWPGPEPWRGLLHPGQPVRSGRPRDAHLPGGDLGPCSPSCGPRTTKTALRLINEHEYGNGTAIFTGDGDTAGDFTTRVQVGMVG